MEPSSAIFAAAALLSGVAAAQSVELSADSASPIAAVSTTVPGDTTHRPADFVVVDKEPVVIKKVEPAYPELAKKAGLEGKVWTKIWVDTEGNAREVTILKSDSDVFNGCAIDAAKQFKFEPALIKGKPVDVWVSVPFRFRLAEKGGSAEHGPDTAQEAAMYALLKFITDVVQGPVPDSSRVDRFLATDAQSVAGGHQMLLRRSIEEQRRGKSALEQSGRRILNVTLKTEEGEKSGYIIVRTALGVDESTSHYHTIVITHDAAGSWKIMCWQSWQGARTPR